VYVYTDRGKVDEFKLKKRDCKYTVYEIQISKFSAICKVVQREYYGFGKISKFEAVKN
jgi:hypothetical protein